MNEITEILTLAKKMTASEIAALAGEPPESVIKKLLHLEVQGKVIQLNGYWSTVNPVRHRATCQSLVLLLRAWSGLTVADICSLQGISFYEAKKLLKECLDKKLIIQRTDGAYYNVGR